MAAVSSWLLRRQLEHEEPAAAAPPIMPTMEMDMAGGHAAHHMVSHHKQS